MTTTSDCLTFVAQGESWPGLQSMRKLVLFGDSYTSFGFMTTLWPEQLKRIPGLTEIEILNYALPGNTLSFDFERQTGRFFTQAKDSFGDPSKTLYVVWLGINDVGMVREELLEEKFKIFTQHITRIYDEAGARNFLFIDVPPVDKAPGVKASGSRTVERIKRKATLWNELLRACTASFSEQHPSATIFVFSSHKVISDYLEEPMFQDESGALTVDELWEDHVHMTDVVHEALAAKMSQSLVGS